MLRALVSPLTVDQNEVECTMEHIPVAAVDISEIDAACPTGTSPAYDWIANVSAGRGSQHWLQEQRRPYRRFNVPKSSLFKAWSHR